MPCEPCKDLIPDPKEPQKPENGDGGCGAEALRQQLEAGRKDLLAKEAEKAKLEADLKARSDRDKELEALIKDFEKIIADYKSKRHDLICREDCLKGFHREASAFFERLSTECKTELKKVINDELCELERAKCCQKNLEWKLKKTTPLIRKQEEADRALKDAEAAFKDIKDLAKWIGAQFTELEGFHKEIVAAINDKDPQKHKWAFYLFYWKYVPALCRRFKVAICCDEKKAPAPEPQGAGTAQAAAPSSAASVHIGCMAGDWYPSQIDEETLTKLICCAWDDVKEKKACLQEVNAEVDATTKNLDFIKKKVDTDTKALNDRIKAKIEPVACPTAGSK